ncbi:hypothetical protein J3T40_08180 [Salmonella enterica]|uniref:hypothetical protein n=2 Tax=Salmonella enterica TaxID=28901 RepID=UPI0021D519C9|nr:hypothetical protein [Salmonella enterica]MCU7147262.1 hypothetical protein [Salmonella enterica]
MTLEKPTIGQCAECAAGADGELWHYRSPSLKGCCNTGDRYLNREHRNQHSLFKNIARSRISCFPDAGATLIFQQNILLTCLISSAHIAGHHQ